MKRNYRMLIKALNINSQENDSDQICPGIKNENSKEKEATRKDDVAVVASSLSPQLSSLKSKAIELKNKNLDNVAVVASSIGSQLSSPKSKAIELEKRNLDDVAVVAFSPSPQPISPKSMAKVIVLENNISDDVAVVAFSPSPQPFSPKSMAKMIVLENNNSEYEDSPAPPLYSPLTPSVAASKIRIQSKFERSLALPLCTTLLPHVATPGIIEQSEDENSPAPPLFSPLTPLVAAPRMIARRMSSPLPTMTPETFEMFQHLSQTLPFTKRDLELNQNNLTVETTVQNSDDDQTTNCSSDLNNTRDSDYVPDSEDDSDDNDISSVPVQTSATVHLEYSQSKTGRKKLNSTEKKKDKADDYVITNYYVETNNTGDSCQLIPIDEETSTAVHLENQEPEENGNSCQLIPINNIDEETSIAVHLENQEPEENSEILISHNRETEEGRPKKGRKRKFPDHTQAEIKDLKYKNLPYNTKKKRVESKVFIDYACQCLKECFVLVPRDLRKNEFETFMSLGSYEAQLLWIVNHVKVNPKTREYTLSKNKTGKKKPRSFVRTYFIGGTKVCKDMFLKTFQISSKKVDISLKKKQSGNSLNDRRGKDVGGWNRTPEEDVNFIKKVINSLPTYESHYRREQSDCKYLKVGMTVQKIYEIYKEELKKEDPLKNPVSFATLKRIFYESFNLRCKTLKKDTCNKCDALKHKINNCTSEELLADLKEEKEQHLALAENLRKQMNIDMARAKIDKTFECLTFDLEKTLPLPRIPTNIVFYKRQLWLYNSGIHAGSSEIGYCNVWLEGEAGRGSQEVGSCLIHFINNRLEKDIEDLVLWSDSCGGQNRNIKIVAMLKAVLESHDTLKTITFKFLEPGHSFLPNDTDFSKIEYQLKYHERIYTPEEYINVMKSCKKNCPLQVYRMKKEDFLSVNKIEKKIVNRKVFTTKEKVNWLKTKEILLKKDAPHSIFMRGIHETFKELDIGKKVKGKYGVGFSEHDFEMLWPNGKEIAQVKLDDLKSMFELIPKDCLQFYKTLKGNNRIVDDVDGFGGEPDFEIEDDFEN